MSSKNGGCWISACVPPKTAVQVAHCHDESTTDPLTSGRLRCTASQRLHMPFNSTLGLATWKSGAVSAMLFLNRKCPNMWYMGQWQIHHK